MTKLGGRARKVTKGKGPRIVYKTKCDICGKRAFYSFVSRGVMRGACRKHLRRVR